MNAKINTKRKRVKFASDNVTGACPEVLEAIIKANDGIAPPYGNDEISGVLQEKFSKIFEKDVIVYPTASGTAHLEIFIAINFLISMLMSVEPLNFIQVEQNLFH